MNRQDIRVRNADYELREHEDQLKIIGYALKFDRPSEDLGFTEYIDRSALDKTDMSNVVGLLNHDKNYVLGRTGKNLKLEVDDFGLRFELTPTQTSYTKDLIQNMREGLIDKCSFAFSLDYSDEGAQTFERDSEGNITRTIHKIKKLYDVSVVTTPAYEDTEALLSARSLESVEKFEKVKEVNESRKREIEIMDMDLEL